MDTTRLGREGLAFGDAEIDGERNGERDGTAEVDARDLTDVDGVQGTFVRSFRTEFCNSEAESVTGSSNLLFFLLIDWLRMESSIDVPDFVEVESKHDIDGFGLGAGVERREDEREWEGDAFGERSMLSEDEGELLGVRLGEGRGNSWSSSSRLQPEVEGKADELGSLFV